MRKNSNPKIGTVIQARMTSSRLPRKVLMDVAGKPMLWHVIYRLKLAKKIDEIILAIPNTKENNILSKFAQQNSVLYFRGSEEDVLARFYGAAKKFGLNVIVRITGDCPLTDPKIVDSIVKKHLDSGSDYTSNIIKRTFPWGLEVEVFNFQVLEKVYLKTKENYQREHVTPYIYKHPRLFKLQNVQAQAKLRHPEFRLTVDTKEDLKLIREIYKHLYQSRKMFYARDIINLFNKYPQLPKINSQVKQKSLKEK